VSRRAAPRKRIGLGTRRASTANQRPTDRPGRRAAAEPRRRAVSPPRRRLVEPNGSRRVPLPALGIVVGSLVAVLGAAQLTQPDADRLAPPRAATAIPVASATAVCPEPVAPDTSTRSRVTAVVPPTAADATGTGSILPLGEQTAVANLAAPGGAVAVDVDQPDRPAYVATANEELAPGLTAGQVTVGSEGDARGIAAVDCAAPDTGFWFVGGSSQVGDRGRLYLTNTADTPAQVDITVYGPDGPVDAPAGRGVVIGPGTRQLVLIDALAPNLPRTAVHVESRAGRVAVAWRQQEVEGLTPLGNDWVPAAAEPATDLLVPGIPDGSGPRLLRVLAPGRTDAIVKLRLVTPDGPVTPTGLEVLEVRGGTVAEIDLSGGLGGKAGAIQLESDEPITASVEARVGGGEELLELAYSSAVPPFTGLAVQPDVHYGGSFSSTLLLTAPTDAEGQLSLSLLEPGKPEPTQTGVVVVPAGTTLAVPIGQGDEAYRALLVNTAEGSAPVYGAMVLRSAAEDGPMVSVQPLRAARVDVSVPDVSQDVGTAVGIN
jgi:Family of unknown function (DUF5719)